ncbi:tripartite tricarboxylate transporter substrate binding protein [Cupriavidus basilensis]|uniref:tripartite tricarboxylate transporter substrate binding protein n=1 Tax=Cupriavidus basilensis TaxID=68895 RepID=UPI0023E82059|nr:tripartite tricarboxylate transporter substrate binding protein [Cupriavidus basilensis]MDF3883023.1 tripartite tricarboxylate transporter substrate binding protein [Cupriavidus basilensis]
MNRLQRRNMGKTIIWLSLALPFIAGASNASSEFPTKPIRVIVPFPAGGTTDQVARIVAGKMREQLGQPLIVDNKGGAGTVIGTQDVAHSPPDGYTLLWTATPLAINASLVKKLPFDTLRDLTMVGNVAAVPLVLIVPPSSPYKTVQSLIQAARDKPNSLSYGSSGVGGSAHLATAMFLSDAGIRMNHVPYKGSAPAVSDLIGGHVDVVFDTLFLTRPYIQAGKARALAQTGSARSPLLPDVPTLQEAGYKNLVVESWHVVAAPAATPPAVVQKLNAALVVALRTQEVKDALVKQGLDIRANTPAEANRYFKSEVDRWAKAVSASGASVD